MVGTVVLVDEVVIGAVVAVLVGEVVAGTVVLVGTTVAVCGEVVVVSTAAVVVVTVPGFVVALLSELPQPAATNSTITTSIATDANLFG